MFKRFIFFTAVVVAGFAVVYPFLNEPEPEICPVESRVNAERRMEYSQLLSEIESRAKKFPGEAGIFIKDLATDNAVEVNASKQFPSASLVKMPIMAVVYQAQEEGRLKITDQIEIKRQHKVRDCSKLYYARNGTKFTIQDLIERMITESDNTATNMLVDTLGFGYINQKFVEFGLLNTDLRRGIMDLKWRRAGIENYTTPQDMASLLERIYKREMVSRQASEEMLAVLKRQKVNDRIPRLLPDDLVVAHKTGLLRGTVSDVGIVFTPKGDFIICVITDDIRSYRSAKRFIARIAATAYSKCYKKTDMVKS